MSGSPGGQVIGRVSVKVLPDTSDFAREARRKLNAEARRADIKIKVKVELDKTSLRKLTDDLKDWKRRVNPIKVEVKPELQRGSTTLINARLNYMSRTRRVPILPYLMPGSMQNVSRQFGTMIAAMSGGRVMKDIISDFGNWLKRLDEIAPKFAIIAEGLVGLTGLGLTAASNLFALSASLASIGAVVMTLPATFAAAAIGVGTMIVVLKDFNKVLPNVKKQLASLQNSMSEKFWAQAKAPIQGFISSLLPAFTKGLNSTSTVLGKFTATFANAFKGLLVPTLPGMFDGLRKALDYAVLAAAPLANIITTLGTVGAQYLPLMGWWVQKIAVQFNGWLSGVAADGTLVNWINNGIAALHELGQVLKNAWGILTGLGQAASAAGGSGLGMIADTLERVNGIVNSPAFQNGLVTALGAAHQMMTNIAATSGPALMNLFTTLANTVNTVMPVIGNTIGTALSAVASALAQPAFQNGLKSLFDGIGVAITALAPAMGPIGAMFGALGKTLGHFIASIGPVAATLFSGLARAMELLLPALNPLISLFSAGLGAAIRMLMPIVIQLGATLANLASAVLPVFGAIIGAILPIISQLAGTIGNVLTVALQSITPLLPMIANMFAQIVPLVGQLLMALMPLVAALLPALAAILGAVIPIIVTIAQAVLPPLIAAVTALVGALVPVINMIAQVVVWLLDKLAPAFTWIANLLMGFVTGLIGGFTSIFEGIKQIWDGFATMFSGGWSNFFNGLWQVAQGIWNIIKGAFNVFMNIGILKVAGLGLKAVKGIFTGGWNAIKAGVTAIWNGLKAGLELFVGALRNRPAAALQELRALFSMAWNTIKSAAIGAFNFLVRTIPSKIGEVIGFVRGIPGQARTALSNIGTVLLDAGRQLISGFVTGLRNAFGTVKSTLQDLTHRLTDWKGPESLDRVLLVNAGQLIIEGFVRGLESRYDTVRKSLQGLTSDIGSTVIASPQIADLSGSYGSISANLAQPNAGMASPAPLPSISVSMESNSSPEDVADAILFAQKRYRYGSAHAQ